MAQSIDNPYITIDVAETVSGLGAEVAVFFFVVLKQWSLTGTQLKTPTIYKQMGSHQVSGGYRGSYYNQVMVSNIFWNVHPENWGNHSI